ncbi:MAG TPA: hypothetical protein VFE78_09105 [Gemmataceae bacterium]|jgi:hypothetical protein|nr:hypothetical protein [Gemmataceae bacterium]
MAARRCNWGWPLLAALVAGCGGKAAPPPCEAEGAVRQFFAGVVDQDWPAAYGALHADGRKRVTVEQFTRLARQYRRGLGFEPTAAHVRSCEERGDEAVAHVTLTGQAAGHQRFHKDAVTLRRGADGWGVVLPARFGQARAR